jgi:hypothetical protein
MIRRNRIRVTAAALAAACAAVALVPASSSAHSAKLITRRWATDSSQWHVSVYFDGSVPGGRIRSRIRDGARVWNGQNRQVVFSVPTRRGIDGAGPKKCQQAASNKTTGVMYWRTIDGKGTKDGDVLGVTRTCYYTGGTYKGRLFSFTQVYDSKQPNWYRKTGNVPNDKYDLWSVTTHEFGHAIGWTGKHYGRDNNSSICASNNKGRETMCPLTYLGQSRQRTLGRHDKHTFKRVYAAR